MTCASCTSSNLMEFPAEVNIHFSGLRSMHKPGIFVFPKLLICRDCGSSSFTTPASELAMLSAAADEPVACQDGVDSRQEIGLRHEF
jgi:hypothetical protein